MPKLPDDNDRLRAGTLPLDGSDEHGWRPPDSITVLIYLHAGHDPEAIARAFAKMGAWAGDTRTPVRMQRTGEVVGYAHVMRVRIPLPGKLAITADFDGALDVAVQTGDRIVAVCSGVRLIEIE